MFRAEDAVLRRGKDVEVRGWSWGGVFARTEGKFGSCKQTRNRRKERPADLHASQREGASSFVAERVRNTLLHVTIMPVVSKVAYHRMARCRTRLALLHRRSNFPERAAAVEQQLPSSPWPLSVLLENHTAISVSV